MQEKVAVVLTKIESKLRKILQKYEKHLRKLGCFLYFYRKSFKWLRFLIIE